MNKITLAPLPSFHHIIKSYFIRNIDLDEVSKPWLVRESDISYWFSRSTISMLLIIQWYQKLTGIKNPVIWLPEYFCNEPVQFLKKYGYQFIFYKINDSLFPDWSICKSMSLKQKPDIFFLVHYFGKCNEARLARKFCNDSKCILVEDAAHVMKPFSEIGQYGDFTFYSQHKLFAIPDGSLLVQSINSKVLKNLSDKDPVSTFREIYMALPKTSPGSTKWLLKRIAQKLLPDSIWLNKKKVNQSKSLTISYKPLQSFLGKQLFYSELKNIDDYILKRKKNDMDINKSYKIFNDLSDHDYIPYMAMLNIYNQEDVNKYYFLKGSPFMKWPDLPEEIDLTTDINSKAKFFKNNHLFVPIHQSINTNAIKRMKKLLDI